MRYTLSELAWKLRVSLTRWEQALASELEPFVKEEIMDATVEEIAAEGARNAFPRVAEGRCQKVPERWLHQVRSGAFSVR